MTQTNDPHIAALTALITSDPWRMRVLRHVEGQHLPDCWVGAGFVRCAVWDHLHGRAPTTDLTDIDVIWFDPQRTAPADDAAIERRLADLDPTLPWSVKNQAAMHLRNGDRPYRSSQHAMAFWPETATAVAVRLHRETLEIAAPFGLDDLFALVVRPTPAFAGHKRPMFDARVGAKRWRERWPGLTVIV